jgi:hypothetical protein
MADYRVAVHEAAHSVCAVVLDVPWHAVTIRADARDGTLGRLIPDRAFLDAMVENNWPAEAFAITCIVGPLAEGQWMGENLERVHEIDWDAYGSRTDFKNARIIADVTGARFDSLLRDAVHFLSQDKIKLAVERVADALVDRHTLITTDVNLLVFGNARGVQ